MMFGFLECVHSQSDTPLALVDAPGLIPLREAIAFVLDELYAYGII